MTDFLARASEHLNARAIGGREVTYVRDLDETTLDATVGVTTFRFDTSTGASVVARSRDYLVSAENLRLNGIPISPTAGDIIKETINGSAKSFEVRSPAPDEPDWRYEDADRGIFRIHTKEVATDDGGGNL